MQARHRLRTRLIVSFAVFGLCLSALFAAAAWYVRAEVEEHLVVNALQQDVDQAVNKALNGKPPQSELVEGWFKSDRTLYKLPLSWQHLKTGVHDIHDTDAEGERHHYKLAVRRKDGIIGFVRYDVSREELGKQQLMIGLIVVVVVFSLLSLAIGFWLSARVMRPVSDLARRLRGFRENGKTEALAPHFARDEVGELARALDEYADRLTTMVARDREFNSDVSHELRTPLAVIGSTTELMQASPDLTDKLRERLKRIERSSRQANEMIEALLLLSRAERRGPTFGETTDANAVARELIENQRPQLRGRDVQLTHSSTDTLTVHAPASVLSVVLTNLVGNAVKYTREGEITVRVLDDRIVVEDTGPGPGNEDTDTLFERGERGAETSSGTGTGLGLAIVRRLCGLYQWDISLQARQDVTGSVAVVRFPTRH